MYRIIKLIFLFLSIIFVLACEAVKKPDFIEKEDYSFLSKRNYALVVLRIQRDSLADETTMISDPEVQSILENFDYQLSFRKQLAKEFYRWDKAKHIFIEFGERGEEENLKYVEHVGRDYPLNEFVNSPYNLILEIDMNVFLSYETGHVDLIKRERMRLINPKNGHIYLSSLSNKTYKSLGKKVVLKRDKKRFKTVIESLVNRSARTHVRYILNQEEKPDKENITPSLDTPKALREKEEDE